jgi:hypothetical protein
MLNLKIYAIIGALALAAGVAFKLYFDYSQEQIATLNKDLQTYKIQNEAQQKAFNDFKDNVASQSEAITELNNKVLGIESKTSQLSRTLARHELDRLAGAKPGLIKSRANKATAKVFENLEDLSQPIKKEGQQ